VWEVQELGSGGGHDVTFSSNVTDLRAGGGGSAATAAVEAFLYPIALAAQGNVVFCKLHEPLAQLVRILCILDICS
jgi:hypothetical protein